VRRTSVANPIQLNINDHEREPPAVSEGIVRKKLRAIPFFSLCMSVAVKPLDGACPGKLVSLKTSFVRASFSRSVEFIVARS